MSLILPGPPMAVLLGVMSGVAFVAQEALPSAGRLLAVRVPDGPALDASNRYMEMDGAALRADLARLGLDGQALDGLDRLVAGFLGAEAMQVGLAEQAAFSGLLDSQHLRLADA